MPNSELLELQKQHQITQDKYTYFLLAITASAIAFSIQKTETLKITYSLIPLGFAVLVWGISFYFGVKSILYVQSCIYTNYGLLQLKNGIHPKQPQNLELVEAAIDGVKTAFEYNSNKVQFYSVWQIRLIILGGILFLFWHILEMIIRTLSSIPKI